MLDNQHALRKVSAISPGTNNASHRLKWLNELRESKVMWIWRVIGVSDQGQRGLKPALLSLSGHMLDPLLPPETQMCVL
eukprot:1072329-Pelagomonas_calceolata.AAC.1